MYLLSLLAEDPLPAPGGDSSVFVVSAPVVTIIIGSILPLIVGLVTKWTTSSKIKAWLLVALSAISSTVTSVIVADGSAVFSVQNLETFVLSFVVAGAAYARIWRANGLSSSTPGPMSGPGVSTDPAFVADHVGVVR